MIARALRLVVVFLFSVAVNGLLPAQQISSERIGPGLGRQDGDATTRPARVADFGRIPLSFEPNQGQAGAGVKFLSRGPGYTLFLDSQEAVFALAPAGKDGVGAAIGVAVELSGANAKSVGEAGDPLPGKSNYYLGNDPRKWHSNIPTFGKVRYHGIYPGTDLVYYGNQQRLEYDFVLAAGSDPKRIELRFRGADKVAIGADGDLVLTAGGRELRMRKPEIYQRRGEEKIAIAGGYLMRGDNRVGFHVGAYDRGRELVIDPQLVFATFLGGSSYDYGYAVAVDSSDNAYLAGSACSSNFPIVGVGTQTVHCYDAFVAKFAASAPATLLYSTVLGGSRTETAYGIAVDGSGNAYVTGTTNSWNFPVSGGWPEQTTLVNGKGEYSGFLAKFDPAGAVVYSGYFGGSGHDEPRAIALDSGGNPYIAGFTTSNDLIPNPTLPAGKGGVYASVDSGLDWAMVRNGMGGADVMALALSPDGTTLYAGTDSGFYYSTNGGATWTANNSFIIPTVPSPSSAVYSILATSNSAACPPASSTGCVFIGTDRGTYVIGNTNLAGNWAYAPAGSSLSGVRSLTIDPQGNLYAGTDNGVWTLFPQGTAWAPLTGPAGMVWSVVADPTTGAGPAIVYAGTGGTLGQLWKSTNGGSTWFVTNAPQTSNIIYNGLAHDPMTSGTVYAIHGNAVYVTTDGGSTWTETGFSLMPATPKSIAIDPTNRLNLFVAGQGGVYKSTQGPNTFSWIPSNGGTGPALGTMNDTAIAVHGANVYVGTFYRDGFVARFDGGSGTRNWAGFLGGAEDDQAWSIAVDSSSYVHVVGGTYSQDFPHTFTSGPGSLVQGNGDAFVALFMTSGELFASRFLGGSSWETARGVAADASGNTYVTGTTYSGDFPVQDNDVSHPAFQNTFGGGTDAYVTKLDTALNILFSTYLGGNGWEDGNAIALDPSKATPFIVGKTWSTDFPMANAYQPYLQVGPDAFFARLDQYGSYLLQSTFLGGDQWDEAFGIAIGVGGGRYIGGYSLSADFPNYAALSSGTTKPSPDGYPSAWLAKFAPSNYDSDVDVSLSGPTSGMSGTSFNYVATVHNLSSDNPSGAPNVVVTLRVSGSAFSFDLAHVSGATSCYTQWVSSFALRCLLGTVPLNGTATVTIPVIPQTTGTLTANAWVATDDNERNMANNASATVTTAISGGVGLSVSMSHTPEPVAHGYNITQTITFTNLYDPISAGSFQFNMPSGTPGVTNSTNIQCSFNSALANETCTFGSLGSGQSLTATIVYSAPTPATYPAFYPVSVINVDETPQTTGTKYAPTGTMTDTITVQQGADLSPSITGAPATLLIDNTATLTITVTNSGPDSADLVTVPVAVPAGMLVSAAVGGSNCSHGWPADHSYDYVQCNLGTIGVSGSASLDLTVRGVEPGYFTFKASDITSTVIDPNSNNNKAFARIQVVPSLTASEQVLVPDRSMATTHVWAPDLRSSSRDLPNYNAYGGMALSPNGRLLFDGRSVVDTTVYQEVGRAHVSASASVKLAQGGSRAVYTANSDTISIVDTATFDTVNTVSLNNNTLLGDNPNSTTDLGLYGLVMGMDVAYMNPAGKTPSGSGFPVVGVDLSSCWNQGSCTPQVSVVANTADGFGVSGPQSIAKSYGRNGLYILALRRTPGVTLQGGELLIIDTGATSPTVTAVPLTGTSSTPSAMAVTKDPADPNRQYAYVVAGTHLFVVDLNTPNTGSTFGQVKQSLVMTSGAGVFFANRIAISEDGTKLYVLNTNATWANNIGVLSVSAVLSGAITWVNGPFRIPGSGATRTVISGYVDNTAPANAPTLQDIAVSRLTNDGPATVTITGTGFTSDARVRLGWMDPIVPADLQGTIAPTQIQFTLPAGTPAQRAVWVVTNTNGGSPVLQQTVSAICAATCAGPGHFLMDSPPNYQPAYKVVYHNSDTNSISIAGRLPLGLPYSDSDTGFVTGSASATFPMALSVDGSRLYMQNDVFGLQALNLTTLLPEPSTLVFGNSSLFGLAPGPDPSSGAQRMYAPSADITSGASAPQDTSVFQIQALDTDPASATYNQQVGATITSGSPVTGDAYPELVAVTPNGQYAYALYDAYVFTDNVTYTQADYLVVFKLASPASVVRVIPLANLGGYVFGYIYVSPDGASLKMAGATNGVWDGSIVALDISGDPTLANPLPTRITATPPASPPGLTTPRLGAFVVYGSNLFAVDATQNLVLAFDANHNQIGSFVIPGRKDLATSYGAMAVSPDGQQLYIADFAGNTIQVLSPSLLAANAANPVITSLSSGLAPDQLWVSAQPAPSADIGVSLTGPALAAPGQQITYIATITNNSSTQDAAISLLDTLPPAAAYVSNSGCVYDVSNINQGCGTGSYEPLSKTVGGGNIYLTPGGYLQLSVVVTAPAATGIITNTLQASATANDPNLANNTASWNTTVTTGLVIMTQSPLPGATVSTTYSQNMAASGGTTPYTWSIATGTLPPGLGLSSDGLLSGTPTQAGTYIFTVRVSDFVSQVQTATLSITVVQPNADLAISAHGTPTYSGSNTTYMVDVINSGPANASTVLLTDTLTRYNFVSGSYSGPGGSGSCTASAGVVSCAIGPLAYPGQATVTVTVANPPSGWASNLFHVSADQPDPNPTNNSAQIGPVTEGANTAVGENVSVATADAASGTAVDVTFSDVMQAGNTTLTATSTGAAPPTGFRSGTPLLFYDLHTTATWSGSATVNLTYSGLTFHHPDKARLFHQENGVWVDRTIAVDPVHHLVTAMVPSFSLFALFEPVNHVPAAAAKPVLAAGISATGASLKLDATPSSDADGDNLTYRWSGPFPEGGGAVTGATPTVTLPLGASNVSLVVNDGETDSAPLAVPVTVSDFAITLPAASVSAARGQTVSLTVTVTPKYGAFDAPITLACPNLPAGASCAFSSPVVTPGAQAATATLTLSAVGPSASSAAPRNLYALWLGMLPFGLLFAGVRRKRAWWLLLAIVLLLLATQFACGGGSNTPATTQTTTQSSTMTVTVSGTSGSLTHTTTATIAVH